MRRFIITFLRYVAAIVMASAVSAAVSVSCVAIFAGLEYLKSWQLPETVGRSAFDIAFVAMGFSGVFAGSLCFEQAGRRMGSIVLLILGVAFDLWLQLCPNDGDPSHIGFDQLLCLAFGGLVAVTLIFLRRPKALLRWLP